MALGTLFFCSNGHEYAPFHKPRQPFHTTPKKFSARFLGFLQKTIYLCNCSTSTIVLRRIPMTQQRIYFNSRDKLIRLDIQKIVYFEGDGNYTYIVTANRQKVCVTMNLSHTEDALASQLGDNAKQFMRIGKRFIVNMNYIYQIDIQKQTLMLSDCEHFLFQLPVSKEALKTVKELVIKAKI